MTKPVPPSSERILHDFLAFVDGAGLPSIWITDETIGRCLALKLVEAAPTPEGSQLRLTPLGRAYVRWGGAADVSKASGDGTL